MKMILEKLADMTSGGIKLLVLITTIIISIYNFILNSLDQKVNILRKEVHQLRNNDTKIINQEINSLNQKIDIGFSDIKDQNRLILQHILRRK